MEPIGLKVQDYQESELQELAVEKDELILFSHNYEYGYDFKRSYLVNNKITPGHVIKAATSLNISIQEAINSYRKYEVLGLVIPRFDVELLDELINSDDDLTAMSRRIKKKSVILMIFLAGGSSSSSTIGSFCIKGFGKRYL